RQAVEAVLEAAVHRVARVALRHDDEVGIELVLHVDGRAIPRDRLDDGDDLDAGGLGRALAFDGLVIDAHTGDPGADALAYHAAHRHHAAVAGVAVHHHRDAHAVGDPARDLDALRHRGGADVGQPGVGAHDAAGADEADLAPRALHDAGQRGR